MENDSLLRVRHGSRVVTVIPTNKKLLVRKHRERRTCSDTTVLVPWRVRRQSHDYLSNKDTNDLVHIRISHKMEVFLTCGWCETALLSGLEKDCRHFGFTRDVNISWMKFLHFTLRSAPPAPLWWARIVGLWSEPLRDQTVIFDRRKRLETCSVCSFVYLNSHPAERMFWWVIKGRVAVMMTAAHLYTLSLSLSLSLCVSLSPLIHFISPGPAEARPCWAPGADTTPEDS